jgi:pyruvate formate lyase activating enzyme
MNIYGLAKTTLLDYPGHMAATIFIGGCNFLCPFCHNRSLVFLDTISPLDQEDVISFLKKRQHLLEGVCITGGEPTLYKELPNFIEEIKNLGYKVKLDTNGTNPFMLKELLEENIIDYIAMDIKSNPDNYPTLIGNKSVDLDKIKDSIQIIMGSSIDYEFRTTLVKELHTEKDILEIGKWIQGAKSYYLQNFKPSNDQIQPGFSSHSKETLEHFVDILRPYVTHIALRGIE